MEDQASRLQVILLILNHLRVSTAPPNAGIVRDLARSAGIVREEKPRFDEVGPFPTPQMVKAEGWMLLFSSLSSGSTETTTEVGD
jgi:hypothetical protein